MPIRTLNRRLTKLHEQVGQAETNEAVTFVVTQHGPTLALPEERCVHILEQSGYLQRTGFAVVDLGAIPSGMDSHELQSYLLTNGRSLCSPRVGQLDSARGILHDQAN